MDTKVDKIVKSAKALLGLITTAIPAVITIAFLVGKICLLVGQLFGANIDKANDELVKAERIALNGFNSFIGIKKTDAK